jgi:hypothetical protein
MVWHAAGHWKHEQPQRFAPRAAVDFAKILRIAV